MLRDLCHVVDREEAEIGLFVTLTEPTVPMQTEAIKAGYYDSRLIQRKYPKIQILTINGLLTGTEKAEYPDWKQGSSTFKKAQVEQTGKQTALF